MAHLTLASASLVALLLRAPVAESEPVTDPHPATSEASETRRALAAASARYRGYPRFKRWLGCEVSHEPCVRPGPARLLLFSLGVVAGGVSSALLFALGDRFGGGDPSTLLVGAGALAGVGSIVGVAFARLAADGPLVPDRVRPETLGLDLALPRPVALNESFPPTMALTFAPTLRFPGGGGRIRLIGALGGLLGTEKQVDPRPQVARPVEGREGTAPVTFRRSQFAADLGLDMAVAFPYPVLPPERSGFFGWTELRYKPEVRIRRDVFDVDQPTERVVERTMLLPLTVGARWHLSPRQRFTIYFGPRFDFVAASPPGSKDVQRGGAKIGPLYGEAWYDIDVPLTARPRRDGKPRKAVVNGLLSGGYVHDRFDDDGINFGPVIGFLGSAHVLWTVRVRPVDAFAAFQGTLRLTIGQGLTVGMNVGVVLPDIGAPPRRSMRR